MQFFEKPRLVTALVFFIQTIIALLNMETFLYLHIFIIFVIPFFFGFPFAFYYVYKFILMDLDKEKVMEEPKDTVTVEDVEKHSKEAPAPPSTKQEAVQAVMDRIHEENQEKNRLQTPDKHIQVIHASDVFTDEEAEPLDTQEQPILNPIVAKKDRTTRQKQKEQVSKETDKLNLDKTVEPAPLPVADEPETEKEA